MKRDGKESSQRGALTDSKTKPESKEKVTLAYPLPRCDRVARQLVFVAFLLTPQATQP